MTYWTTGKAGQQLDPPIVSETVRYYERIGLISPTRDASGRRLLTAEDIDKIRQHRERRQNVERGADR